MAAGDHPPPHLVVSQPHPGNHHETQPEGEELPAVVAQQVGHRIVLTQLDSEFEQWQDEECQGEDHAASTKVRSARGREPV